MLNDLKHSEPLKIWLTEREFVDLARLAIEQDRKPGEMARVALRQVLYGILGRRAPEGNESNSPE